MSHKEIVMRERCHATVSKDGQKNQEDANSPH